MLSDYYPPERRGTVFSIYALGIPIGSAIGIFTGGWIVELFDWRTAFFVVGLPGIALAGVVRLTLREPPRPPQAAASHAGRDTFVAVLRYMQRLPSFRHLSLAAALHAFYGYGANFFLTPFMIRVHGFSEGELSTYLALIALIAGGLGTFLGGFVCDRLAPRDRRFYVWVPAVATAIAIPFSAGLYLSPDRYVALAFAAPAALLGSMYLGPTFAISQGLAQPHMRALVSAILLFIINLLGLGLGPQAVGFFSDLLKPSFGIESVRYALLYTVAIGAAWSTLHYALAARTLREDLATSSAQS
jgi:predicted MFS family arabinose efflux permease